MRKLSVLTILVGSMLVAEEAARADPLDASALKGDRRALPNPDRRGKPSRPLSGAPDGVAVTGHALRRENGDACRRQLGGILGADVVMQHFADLYAGTFVMAPHYDRVKTVGLTPDVAETYAPLDIAVSYAGQTPAPKPFLMIVTWIRTSDGWKMATDVALRIPPAPTNKS